MIRTFFIALLLGCTPITTASATDPALDRALEMLRQAVNQHDYRLLEPQLAPEFTYQGRGADLGRMIMQQVVTGFPEEVDRIVVDSVTRSGDRVEILVAFESGAKTTHHNLVLDADYRFLQADIASIQLAAHAPPDTAPEQDQAWPDRTVVPFELASRLIVVQATVNGVSGNFLFDSGAPSIILNRASFTQEQVETRPLDHVMPAGAGGAMQDVTAAADLTVELGGLVMTSQRGLMADLSHLAESVGIPLVGLIGQDVMAPFQLSFDYANVELTLLRLGPDNQPVAPTGAGAPTLVVDLEMHGHIPVVPVIIGGQVLRMGLDSGAAGAMIFTRLQESLTDHYTFLRRDEMKGADTAVQMGDVVRFDRVQLGSITYDDMTFRFNDIIGNGVHEPPFDGLLG